MRTDAITFSVDAYAELVLVKGTHVVETLSGRPVRIICTDANVGPYTIVALIKNEEGDDVETFMYNGQYHSNDATSRINLVLAPKPPKSLGWVAILENEIHPVTTMPYATKQELLDMVKQTGSVMLSEPVEHFAKGA